MEAFVSAVLASLSQKMLVWLLNVLGKPLLHLGMSRGLLLYDQTKASFTVKKLKKAKEENNENEYDNIADNC